MSNEQDSLGTPLSIASFCIPILGLILYFMNKDAAPVKAKTALKMAIIGIVVGVVLNVLMTLLGALAS